MAVTKERIMGSGIGTSFNFGSRREFKGRN